MPLRKSVYIETTIPSAYVSRRGDVRSQALRQATREWWRWQRENYDVVTSRNVMDELTRAAFPGQSTAVRLTASIRQLEINDEVLAIAAMYVREMLMPGPPDSGDAVHLAVAAYYSVDFLLTWNIRQLSHL